jgi:small GTP-binding protein
MSNNINNTIKIIILGSSTVGKTSLLVRGFDNTFEKTSISTIGIDLKAKYFIFENTKIKANYIDTAGQEKFRAISLNYLKGTDGALLIFDVTKKMTFEIIKNWDDDLKENNGENIPKILVGNKVDLEDEREVSKEEGENLANDLGCQYYETSAKTGQNVVEVLDEIAKITYLYWNKFEPRQTIILNSQDNSSENDNKTVKKKCCLSSKQ